jgi:MFS family permease
MLPQLPPLKPKHFGAMLLLIISWMGVGVALMPLFASTAVLAVIMLLVGVANGYVNINFFMWLQKRTPQELMGRAMSLLFFVSIGLVPVSNALAGAILEINLNVLFIAGGVLMTAVSLLSILLPAVRQMGLWRRRPMTRCESGLKYAQDVNRVMREGQAALA